MNDQSIKDLDTSFLIPTIPHRTPSATTCLCVWRLWRSSQPCSNYSSWWRCCCNGEAAMPNNLTSTTSSRTARSKVITSPKDITATVSTNHAPPISPSAPPLHTTLPLP
ncbi:hypothetical protein SLE2022_175450 [Rubroshorea leprosula]